MKTPIITVKHLHKSFSKFKAVNDLSFCIFDSECFGFLGPNGAGKTTTMKILFGKSFSDGNKDEYIDVLGHNPKAESLQIKAKSGIVPQQDNLDTGLSVRDNLYIYSKFYGMNHREAKRRIDELLDFMELQEKATSNVRELSGGMQRRLTIARALLNHPKLLILDEPTTGLDPQVRHLIWNKLRELKEMGVTILLTTHYMEEAFQICDRILIMDKGNSLIEGNPRTLLSENIEPFVMEVYRSGPNNIAFENLPKVEGIRYEYHEETIFAYSKDMTKLTNFSLTLKENQYNIRHSHLEDLFLQVTGRNLNELQ